MQQARINQTELSRKTSISKGNISCLCNGRYLTTSAENLQRLAEALNVSIAWLAGQSANMQNSSLPVAIPFYGKPVLKDNILEGFEPEKTAPYLYSQDYFAKFNCSPENCKCFIFTGDNMEPLICDGDGILVDCSDNNPFAYNKSYPFLLLINKLLCIYKVRTVFDEVHLESVNSVYGTKIIKKDDFIQSIAVIGRVKDRFGNTHL